MSDENACKVCGRSDNERPTIFRGLDYCCDDCRKAMNGETPTHHPI